MASSAFVASTVADNLAIKAEYGVVKRNDFAVRLLSCFKNIHNSPQEICSTPVRRDYRRARIGKYLSFLPDPKVLNEFSRLQVVAV